MRKWLKRLAEQGAVRGGLPGLLAWRVAGRGLILAYHNVVPDGESPWGEQTLHVPFQRFKEHVEILQTHTTLVPLRTLLTGTGDPSGPPQVALTFDDGYRGAVVTAGEWLRGQGVPATFFVNPGLLECEGFWWDRLAQGFGGELPGEIRAHCLEELVGRQEEVCAWARFEGMATPSAPDHARPADPELLRGIADTQLLELQCHSWSHPNLSRLTVTEQEAELDAASTWLNDNTGGGKPYAISYPYGLTSTSVQATARATGFAFGLLVAGGWMPPVQYRAPFQIPRLNIPSGLSPEGLRLRLVGVGR